MGEDKAEVGFPRRSPVRRVLQWLDKAAFWLLTDLEIIGEENFPPSGPLIVVANHFSFIDPAAVVRIAPWPLDFVGGAHMPHAPKIVTFIPRLWGYLPVYRGTGSHAALRDGDPKFAAVFNQRIILDRNKRMAERMESRLHEGGRFIAVGALHLPGKEGLLELLEQRGYRLTRLY